jgi:LCP family protein required for cell wall assembly
MTQQARGGRRIRRRVLGWVSVAVVAAVTVGLLGAYWKYRAVWTSIKHVPVAGLGKRPPQYTSALNLLVFASGETSGLTRRQQLAWHVGADHGDAVSETIMIVHVSPGRHRVTVVNIPRDTVVPVYACKGGHGLQGQQASPGATEQIDSTLSYGGPSCLWKTVEQQTGIRIDHFAEVGYAGVVKVVNDIGGVQVCLPFGVQNQQSGLRLTKGQHHINGVQFLEFWRTRENIGNGSDLQRIQRDDYLLARALDQTLHQGLFSNPGRMLQVISDGAQQLTLDSGFSQSDLLHIGESLRGLPAGAVQFIEAPTVTDPSNANWVDFAEPQSRRLFKAIAHDRTLPKSAAQPGGAKHPAVLAATASPSQVSVTVLNGSGVAGQASQVATKLAGRGFHIAATGDAPNFGYTGPVIEYRAKSQLPKANALAAQVPGARLRLVPSVPAGRIELILGASFKALAPKPKPAAPPVSGLAKKYGGITGSASCHADTAAFQGPLSP